MHGDIDESHRFAEFGPNHLERARTDAAGKDEDIGRIMPIDEAAESVTQARAIIIDSLASDEIRVTEAIWRSRFRTPASRV